MIIEFLGVPASGKSTLEEKLRKDLSDQGYRLYDHREIERIYMAFYGPFRVLGTPINETLGKVWFYLTLTVNTIQWLGLIRTLSTFFRPVKFKTAYWLIKDRVLYQFFSSLPELKVGRGSVYLTSEGMAQHAAGVIAWNGDSYSKLALDLIVNLASAKITVVKLDLPLDQALTRSAKRELPRSWPIEKAAVKTLYLKYYKALDIVEERLSNSGVKVTSAESLHHTIL